MSYNRNRHIIKSKLKFKPSPNYLLDNNIIHYDNRKIASQLHNSMDKLNKWKIKKDLNQQLFIRSSKIELEKRNIFSNREFFYKNRNKIKKFFLNK